MEGKKELSSFPWRFDMVEWVGYVFDDGGIETVMAMNEEMVYRIIYLDVVNRSGFLGLTAPHIFDYSRPSNASQSSRRLAVPLEFQSRMQILPRMF
jgi:hypothetical protein